jgi:hypothetical protein
MGAYQSTLDPRYVRIWQNLCSLQSPVARLQMVETLLAGPEYVAVAKQTGLYSGVLAWLAAMRRGEYGTWPTCGGAAPPVARITAGATAAAGGAGVRGGGGSNTALARIPPPKRALDVLHESYAILGIDDTQPLTHDALRAAYKRAALRAHPDKGGSHEAFDAVTKAFTYLQEVLNKLLPKSTAGDGTDARFTAPVTADAALRARGMAPSSVAPAPAGTPRIADAPPVALNPKKLDMTVFNKLFEENRLPDPDADDGYGDWLKSQEAGRAAGGADAQAKLRGKYNADVFNKMFEEEARRGGAGAGGSSALLKYAPPSDLISSPDVGVELGGGRPAQYTKAPVGAKGGMAYTDLKYAYGEGSTFSQEVAGLSLDGRPRTLEEAKREYGSAPSAMTPEQAAAVASFDAARKAAEDQRMRRLAARDVDAEAMHEKMRSRLMIRN